MRMTAAPSRACCAAAYSGDRSKARAFNESVEYAAARRAREGAAVMRMVLIEGV